MAEKMKEPRAIGKREAAEAVGTQPWAGTRSAQASLRGIRGYRSILTDHYKSFEKL
jgi:hypothetical protein